MSGQYTSTPLEALRLETGIESYETTGKRLTAKANEKARRLEETHPRYKTLNNNAASNDPGLRAKALINVQQDGILRS